MTSQDVDQSSSPQNIKDLAVYREDLKFLTNLAYDEYKILKVDYKVYQANLIKTYLWITSIVGGLQFSFFYKIFIAREVLSDKKLIFSVWHCLPAILALTLTLLAFFVGVDTLRGRSKSVQIAGKHISILNMIKKRAQTSKISTIYPTIISRIDKCSMHEKTELTRKGNMARKMSWLIMFSIILTFFLLSILAIDVYRLNS